MRYILMLNDMRSSNIENVMAVKVGERQELIDWHHSMLGPSYMDGQWQKVFKQGSELEWFNPGSFHEDNYYSGGVYGPIADDVPVEQAMQARLYKR